MKGLLVWAHSYCRSTLAFYEGLAKAFDVPFRVVCWKEDCSIRTVTGHSDAEFSHFDLRFIGDDLSAARAELANHINWHHLFGTYQIGSVFRTILFEAKNKGCHVAIASEEPCNMVGLPRSILKELYISTILHQKVAKQIHAADYIINLSGDSDKNLRRIGWPAEKIISCGYYSPPIVGSSFNMRGRSHWKNFTVLMTGCHAWHRNPMVLLHALKCLRQRGVKCSTIITQKGPLLAQMINFSDRHQLGIEFAGFVSYEKLIELYQTCSCFVATGRAEPWGIRVNDALHCGAPLIVSDGMGSVKLVADYNCGLSFTYNNPVDLAEKLQSLIMNEEEYLRIARVVHDASNACLPHRKSLDIANVIKGKYAEWV